MDIDSQGAVDSGNIRGALMRKEIFKMTEKEKKNALFSVPLSKVRRKKH